MPSLLPCALFVAASTTAPAMPAFEVPVGVEQLLGTDLKLDHFDEAGFPESPKGLLVIEVDDEVGPIIIMLGDAPHYVEAQFTNMQRDAVYLARSGDREDPLPDGSSFTIPYGYGAL